jgi:hypothetical protein
LPNYAPQEYFDRFPLEEIELPEGFRENDLDDVPKAHSKMAHNPEYAEVKQVMRQELPTHQEPDGATYTPVGYKWNLQKPRSKK